MYQYAIPISYSLPTEKEKLAYNCKLKYLFLNFLCNLLLYRWFLNFPFDLLPSSRNQHIIGDFEHNATLMSLMPCWQIPDDTTCIIEIFCSNWTSHRSSHLRLCLPCDIALRNPFFFLAKQVNNSIYFQFLWWKKYCKLTKLWDAFINVKKMCQNQDHIIYTSYYKVWKYILCMIMIKRIKKINLYFINSQIFHYIIFFF